LTDEALKEIGRDAARPRSDGLEALNVLAMILSLVVVSGLSIDTVWFFKVACDESTSLRS